ncbi:MAG: hypothetical protein IT303_10850 [Dehalococcoidia bacterium]|nr:hypothetical protein [Dehalococcoidia bacterium]
MPSAQQQLAFAIRAQNEAAKAMDEVRAQLANIELAGGDAEAKLSNFDQTLADVFDAAEGGGSRLEGLGTAIGGLAEAGGNAERALMGVSDITGFLNEQFGISLGPIGEYANSFAQLGGGIEAALQGGPALLAQLKTMPATLAPAIASTWAYVSALIAQAAAFIAANAPIILIVGGIALLAGGIILLITHWDTITAKVPALGAALGVVSGAFDAVTTAAGNVLSWLTGNWATVATIISGPFAPIALLATDAFGVRSALQDAFTAVKGWVTGNWPEIAAIISGPFFPLVALASDAFGVRSALEGGLSAARTFVGERIGEIVGFFTNLPGQITATLSAALGAGTALGEAIRDGLVSGLQGIAQRVGDITGALIGAVKAAWNAMVDWADRNFKMDIDLGVLGSYGIDPDLSIFKLAEGAIVTRPTLALIGEAGQPEAVVPLHRAESMGFRGGGGDVHIHIEAPVYGVDHLIFTIDRALKRTGARGLVG